VKLSTWLPPALVVVTIVVLSLVAAPSGGARSVHDHTGRGYRAAFAYLGGTDTPDGEPGAVTVVDGPLAALAEHPRDTTLVLTWPLERPLDPDTDPTALLGFVTGGGRLLLLLDGAVDAEPAAELVEDTFGMLLLRDGAEAPYAWAAWRAWAADRRAADGAAGTVALGDPAWTLVCPADADRILLGRDGAARGCRRPLGDGEVIVLSDATVFQNDHLGRADNLALLDALLGGRRVGFLEGPHGVAPIARTVPTYVPLLLFVHLFGLWGLAAATLARRFGDPLPPAALPPASMARALHALGTLHRGKSHARDAAARLATLLRARAARRGVPADTLPPAPTSVVTDDMLVKYAERVAAAQTEHRL